MTSLLASPTRSSADPGYGAAERVRTARFSPRRSWLRFWARPADRSTAGYSTVWRHNAIPRFFTLVLILSILCISGLATAVLFPFTWPFLAVLAVISIIAMLICCDFAQHDLRVITHVLNELARGNTSVRVASEGGLADLNTAVNSAVAAINARDNLMKASARSVAHDVKTPLAQAMLRLDRLIVSCPDGQAVADARVVRDLVVRVSDAISTLGLVSADPQYQPAETATVYLAGLVREVLADVINTEADERHTISFHLEKEAQGAVVLGSRLMLRRAVINLVRNSIKHNPAGCAIKVTLEAPGPGHVAVRVTDDGGGASAEELAYARERLDGLMRGTIAAGSNGMGLFVVRQTATGHGGGFTFDSPDGQGFTSVMTLPRHQSSCKAA
jgi:signal transduction histidine kinase